MRKCIFTALLFTMMICSFNVSARRHCTRRIDPLVSTEWLADHYNDPSLVLIDVRTAEIFAEGHIALSTSVPIAQWWVIRDDLLLELPEADDLRALIGSCGINNHSKVVIIGQTDSDYDRADATRAAWTLIYGGVEDVAILNGGFTKWVAESRTVTTELYTPPIEVYTGQFNKRITVDKSYVRHFLHRATIIDARIPEDFFGVSPLMFSEREGHIAGAACLPTPWIFTDTGTFKDADILREMASGVIGKNRQSRVIVYCGVGGYAATWWFVLSEILGYHKVRVYDGSIQEWTRDPNAPVEKYSW